MLLLFLFSVLLQPHPMAEGHRLLRAGRTEEAVKSWADAFSRTVSEDSLTTVTGLTFIEHSVLVGKTAYEETATRWYFRSIQTMGARYPSLLKEEAHRLYPILPLEEQSRWEALPADSSLVLASEIRRFWNGKDEIPATSGNEALLRHWKRIAIARTRFRQRELPPYGADDRAALYVKYGEPFKIKNLQCRVSDFRNPFNKAAVPVLISSSVFFEVEVWTYEIPEYNRPLVFYFGANPENGRKYGQVINLMDLVPIKNNWSPRIFDSQVDITPSQVRTLMKFAAMQALSQLSQETSAYYQVLENQILSSGTESTAVQAITAAVLAHDSRIKNDYKRTEENVPAVSLGENAGRIIKETSALAWRLFNDNGAPRILYGLQSDVSGTLPTKKEQKKRNLTVPAQFTVRTTLNGLTERGLMQARSEAFVRQGTQSETYMMIEAPKNGTVSWGAEWFAATPQVLNAIAAGEPDRLRGLLWAVSVPADLPVPPHHPADGFEISDLITGTPAPGRDAGSLPVVPFGRRPVSKGDTVRVYFEVGTLPEAAYRLDVQVRRPTERPRSKSLITLNMQKYGRVDREFLELPLEGLRNGPYVIDMTFQSGGRTKSRTCPIEIRR